MLLKLSQELPLVKKSEDKLMREAWETLHYCTLMLVHFRKAWAEEEAKVQRSMVSYILLRARKSEKTRLVEIVPLTISYIATILQGESSEPGDAEGDGESIQDTGTGGWSRFFTQYGLINS